MSSKSTRRKFLKTSLVTTTGFWVAGGVSTAISKSPNERLQFACFGIGGKGDSDSKNASEFGKVFAICDTDRQRLDSAAKAFRVEDRKFTDYRELLDRLGDRIDAVTVSTPDHAHAVIAAAAMKMGKHCYCQKPLTHSIWEARRLGEIALENKVSTQMGNQGTNIEAMRRSAYQIRAGLIGKVNEVHVWTNRPVWPQGVSRPAESPVPDYLDWESWIGPAPFRPYADGAYHPFRWRGWWDFGCGALGDMACHTCNMVFMALDMRNPATVQAMTSGHNGDSLPAESQIDFQFPERNGRPAFKMTWYDGGNRPSADLFSDFPVHENQDGNPIKPPAASGVLFIGDSARFYVPGDYGGGNAQWTGNVDETKLEVDFPPSTPPKSTELGHVREWIESIYDPSKPAVSNFPNYAGPLTETILVGNLAVWNAKDGRGDLIEWDADNLHCKSHPELQRIVRPAYRPGYEI